MGFTIDVYQGDSQPVTIRYPNADGTLKDLTGYSVHLVAKHSVEDADGIAVFDIEAVVSGTEATADLGPTHTATAGVFEAYARATSGADQRTLPGTIIVRKPRAT